MWVYIYVHLCLEGRSVYYFRLFGDIKRNQTYIKIIFSGFLRRNTSVFHRENNVLKFLYQAAANILTSILGFQIQ